MEIILIAAISQNGYIGKNGKLPWDHIPEDMKHFRDKTMGKVCIYGKNTWEKDLERKPLPGRINIVLGHDYTSWKDLGYSKVDYAAEKLKASLSGKPFDLIYANDEIAAVGVACHTAFENRIPEEFYV